MSEDQIARRCLTGRISRGLHIAAVIATAILLGALGASIAQATPVRARPQISGTSYLHRHGLVPLRGSVKASPAPVLAAGSVFDLSYHGGVAGVGVTTGPPRVYLVFYGSQWGTQSTTTLNGQSYAAFSGDPQGMAPDLQAFFAGLGTNSELWSGVMTQYCESSVSVTVLTGSTSCPTGALQVGYPSGAALGGALAGVWEDTGAPSPAAATQADLALEAEAAAAHFGNPTSAANRNAQYFIVSPTGANPDNYLSSGFCAWHDYTGGTSGYVAYTNMPYVTDAGSGCGENYVNSGSAGLLDGVTIVGGHEYAETITDQFPAGGWYNATYGENGDLCAWGQNGGISTDVSLATGPFAVQPTWSNADTACVTSAPIVFDNLITVTPPASQTSTVGFPITGTPTVSAIDSAAGQTLTYSATGLPPGLTIDPTSGVISGTPTTAVTNVNVTAKATDTTGAFGTASFAWTVNNPPTMTVSSPGNKVTPLSTTISALQIHASDGTADALTYSASGLPNGLSLNSSTGWITGKTGSTAKTSSVTITVTDTTVGSNGTTNFTWSVRNVISVRRPGNRSSKHNVAIARLHIVASDTQRGAILSYSSTKLPRGLTLNRRTGAISGRPTQRHRATSITVTVRDLSGASGSTRFAWTVK